MSAIELKNVIYTYDNKKTILNIKEFVIDKDESVFIYGPSGYGKSTLLNLIAGVITTSSGDLKVLGSNLSSFSQGKRDVFRGEKIGYIFQSFNLIPYLTVLENVLLPCKINKARAAIDAQEEALSLLSSLGLSEFVNAQVANLSIGQQQRVACARALIGKPALVIADEPTSSLDQKNTKEFMDLLISLKDKYKFTLIFVSHDERLKSYFNRTISLPEINQHA